MKYVLVRFTGILSKTRNGKFHRFNHQRPLIISERMGSNGIIVEKFNCRKLKMCDKKGKQIKRKKEHIQKFLIKSDVCVFMANLNLF